MSILASSRTRVLREYWSYEISMASGLCSVFGDVNMVTGTVPAPSGGLFILPIRVSPVFFNDASKSRALCSEGTGTPKTHLLATA